MQASGECSRGTTPGSEVSGKKRPKQSSPNDEAHKSLTVITMDSPERAPDVMPALDGVSRDASKEACASLENGVPARRPPNAARVEREALSDIVVGSSFSARLANADPRRPRLPDWLMLSLYVLPQEWDHHW